MFIGKSLSTRILYYIEAYFVTNEDVLEPAVIKELQAIISYIKRRTKL